MKSERAFMLLVSFIRWTASRKRTQRKKALAGLVGTPGYVLFIGDSITEGGPWQELFPERQTINQGIGWDTSEDLLDRLNESIGSPSVVSLLIGTNDLHVSARLREPRGIAARMEKIVQSLCAAAPQATVIVNGILPRSSYFAPEIQAINVQYRRIAEQNGCIYLDAWPVLADPGDAIRKELTLEGLHLNPAGYRAWSEILRPAIMRSLEGSH